ncbi:zf-HC2 domain-containing protein [Dokdonella sp.]|uniref:anti-sigma factor family protein n=1 Tax=Dokdonella sp. TaxID=2291710 RepID=UPI001B0607D1|nr:zf-HC2 domain-containing protein [Dokdonella sp.]MBO9664162.1 zf-HC2 domain-containing protein [Dokdonella sp.]
MTAPILLHRQLWDLIPWVVNGSADAAERQALEEHLPQCADCREEYAFQTRLHAGIAVEAPDAPESDAQAGLRRLFARIDASADADAFQTAVSNATQPRRFRLGSRGLIAAVVVQAVGLALFAALLLQRERAGAHYETLTSTPAQASHATIRLVPAPTLTLAELQTILVAEKLQIVESNASGSIYGLAPGADAPAVATAQTIEHLRRQPGILLAEPIASPAAR